MDRLSHRIAVRLLLALGGVMTVLALLAIWAERQVLDTDEWVETSSELLADAEIKSAVQGFLVDQLFQNVDVEQKLGSALPPQLQPLTGPLAGAIRQFADEVAGRALESAALEDAWAQANRTAHGLLMDLLEGEGDLVSADGGVVTLDLRELLRQLAARVGVSPGAVDKLPEAVGEVEVLKADEITTAQNIAKLVHGLAFVFSILTVLSFAAAIFLSRGRRSRTALWTGLILILAGVLVFAFRKIAGQEIVSALVEVESVKPAVANAWTISTSLLASLATTLILYGLVVVAAAWLGSSAPGAAPARRGLAPVLRDHPAWAYGIVIVAGLVYFVLAPTHGVRAAVSIALIVALACGAVLALRRQTEREFPDEQGGRVRAWVDDWLYRRKAARAIARAEAERARMEAEAAAEAAAPNPRLDELERLAALRDRGVLTDEEFESEKARALAGPPSA